MYSCDLSRVLLKKNGKFLIKNENSAEVEFSFFCVKLLDKSFYMCYTNDAKLIK